MGSGFTQKTLRGKPKIVGWLMRLQASMCRASAKDNAQVADLVTYYGILTDIILLDYHVFYVPVF